MAPSHYQKQCWDFVNWTFRNKLQWNFKRNSNIFFEENTFENVVCEMSAILSRPQCVKQNEQSRSCGTLVSRHLPHKFFHGPATKPSHVHEPILTYHQRCSVAFTSVSATSQKCSWTCSMCSEIILLKLLDLPGRNELKTIHCDNSRPYKCH